MAAALFKAAPGGPRPHPLALEPEAALVEEPAAPPVAPLGDPRTTRYAGAFLLYAALARVDLWGVFRRLAVTTGPARWYGWAHTVAAIVCGFGLRFRSLEPAGPLRFRRLLWPDFPGACNSSPDTDGVLQPRRLLIMLDLLAIETSQSCTDL